MLLNTGVYIVSRVAVSEFVLPSRDDTLLPGMKLRWDLVKVLEGFSTPG